jgi:hypothetical protein
MSSGNAIKTNTNTRDCRSLSARSIARRTVFAMTKPQRTTDKVVVAFPHEIVTIKIKVFLEIYKIYKIPLDKKCRLKFYEAVA